MIVFNVQNTHHTLQAMKYLQLHFFHFSHVNYFVFGVASFIQNHVVLTIMFLLFSASHFKMFVSICWR